MNAVEREPVPTRVLNPNTSEASYKPKQRSYRNILKPFQPNENWAETVLGRNDQKPNNVVIFSATTSHGYETQYYCWQVLA